MVKHPRDRRTNTGSGTPPPEDRLGLGRAGSGEECDARSFLLFVPDGAADLDRSGGLSPLAEARTPNADFLAREGVSGLMRTLYPYLPRESMVAQLGMLGWDPCRFYPHGRSSCELLALEHTRLDEGDLAFRANLVQMDGPTLVSYSAGFIATSEAAPLIAHVDRALRREFSDFELYHNADFRNTLVVRGAGIDPRRLACPEPHENQGWDFDLARLITGRDAESQALAERIDRYLVRAAELLAGQPANALFPWSASRAFRLPPFSEVTGFRGRAAVIGFMDFLKGIARAGGLDFVRLGNGRPDTDYRGKGEKVIELLEAGYELVVCHVNAPDEASHMGDRRMKIESLEAFDRDVLGPPIEWLRAHPERLGGVMLAPDHYTNHQLGKGRADAHSLHPVPFCLWNGIERDAVQVFSEDAALGGLLGQRPVSHLDLLRLLGVARPEPQRRRTRGRTAGQARPAEPGTLVDVLCARASAEPNGWAYSFLADGEREEERLTWGELDRRARALAASLQERGLRGERVLLLLPPGLDFIAAFFGCLYAGAVAVPSYPPGSARSQPRLLSIFADARPRVVLTTREIAAKWPALAADLAGAAVLAAEDIAAGAACGWHRPELEPDTLAFLQYTSGSTSDPKGVMVSHGNLLHNERMIRDACRHDERSTFVSWLPMYHDMGLIGCLLQPLYIGAPCVLMSPFAFLQRPERWLHAISRFRAHTSGGPDFAYDLCVRKISRERCEGLDLSCWRVAFNGAEPVHAGTLDAFVEAFAPIGFRREAFFPCYGLAEATLIVSGCPRPEPPVVEHFCGVEEGRPAKAPAGGVGVRPLVSSGRVLLDQKVAIVDPETGAPAGEDRSGEIWVSGPSVGRGYWRRPAQTERDFHARLPGDDAPYLRTGDLGFLLDGQLWVTGRLKDLIIVRGRNHYPQDLERTAGACHPALRPGAGAAFAVETPAGEGVVLVQEVKARRAEWGEAIEAVRRAVAEEHGLSPYGVLLVRPGAVPKTTSGKVQRLLCHRLYLEGGLDPVAAWRWGPATTDQPEPDLPLVAPGEIAVWLRSRVARHLGVEPFQVDPERSLARLGLDSIEAIELAHAVAGELGAELPLAALLAAPSLASLAAHIEASLAAPSPAPAGAVPESVAAELPLAPGPRGLWLLHQLDPESPAYNLAGAGRLIGEVDDRALRRAFEALIGRHAALRSTFPAREGGPVQRVHDRADLDFDQSEVGLEGEALLAALCAEACRPFDLERGPLLRVRRLDTRAGERFLLLSVHHIVSDFWSLAVLLDELGRLYAAEVGGRPATLPPPSGPPPAVRESDIETRRRLADRWRARLEGFPTQLDLPADRPLPVRPRHLAADRLFRIEPEVADRLRALARRQGATPFAVLLAAFEAWLHRTTGRERLLVGSPTAGRSQPDLARQVGYLVNPAVIRSDAADDPPFEVFLERTRGTVLEALEDVIPLPQLVDALQPERDPARPALVQVMFALQKAPRLTRQGLAAFALGQAGVRLDLDGLVLESVALPERPGQFELVIVAADLDGRVAMSLQADLDLFDRATAARMARQVEVLVASLAADPTRRLSELAVLGVGERWQVVAEWNDTARAPSAGGLVHERVREVALRAPHAPAVVQGELVMTYGELVRRAGGLAARLRRLGAGPEVRVAVLSERCPEMIVSLLAVLESGGAYVPIDPSYPPERVAWLLEDCGARVVLTREPLAERLVCSHVEVLRLDDREDTGEAPPPGEVDPAGLAYVVYTSGSTGQPKGVQVSHESLLNLIDWHLDAFGVTAADVASQVAGVGFDASTWEIWPYLAAGARLELPREEVRSSPELLRDWLVDRGVSIAFAPTPLAHELVVLDWPAGAHLRLLLTGGDELRVRPRPDLGFELWNNYGPTENTVVATSGRVAPEGWGAPDLGRPIHNVRVHLLGPQGRPAPPGVPGEVCLGGTSLARGYLGRPDLTAERFVPDPFGGVRLYRTGDLARWRSDGTLEFLGRIDEQVKVRGWRIEPAEIEAALRLHPGVREAVVLAPPDRSGGRQLVAFVIAAGPAAPPDGRELRGFLADRVPAFMVPSRFLPVAALPLTPNGKVDRRALLALAAPSDAREASGPRTPLEEVLSGIVAEALGLDDVGLQDDFFELGGHSLTAARVVAQVRETLRADLPLRRLFERPTMAGLAAAVEEARRSGEPDPPPRPRTGTGDAPLTFGQERLWFLARLQPDNPAYNVPAEVRLTGEIRVPALAAALRELERRHEALRATFPEVGGMPVQRVGAAGAGPLPVVDLSALEEPRRTAEAQRLARTEARRPFDLVAGPLVRERLLRLEGREHRLLLVLHHAICDGRSLEVLLSDFAALYPAAEGRPSWLPEPPLQLTDVAVWERERLASPGLAARLTAWERRLAGAPVLELSVDRPRPAVQTLRGGSRSLALPPGLARSVSSLARRERATPFMLLLAAFTALLHRYTGQRDLIVGAPAANRGHAGLESLVGFLVNTLALRAEASGELPFRGLLARVRQVTLEAFDDADVPFEKVVERLHPERVLSHTPLFQVTLSVQQGVPRRLELSGLEIEMRAVGTGTAKFDLSMLLDWEEEGPAATLEYAADLFDAPTMDRMLRHFVVLLDGASADPGRPLAVLPLLPESERFQVLVEWNDRAEPAALRPVPEEVEALAERAPDALAVEADGARLTYRELDRRASAVAHRLRALGVGPERVVAVLLRRSPAMVAGVLGVLKAGGAYAPLDPESPAERLVALLREADVGAVLTERALLPALPIGLAPMVCVDAGEGDREGPTGARLEAGLGHLAYVIFTSGSTGAPKAVALTHAGLANLVSWHRRAYGVRPEDRAAQLAGVAFDASVWEVWPYLTAGASLHLPDEEVRLSPARLACWLAERRITLAFLPTPLAELVLREPWPAGAPLRSLLTGGDRLRRRPEARHPFLLVNHYGPSEGTVVSTCTAVAAEGPAWRPPAIGRPIANVRVHVLDGRLEPVPIGVPGELCLGGSGLARGYLGRPAATAERFVPDPFGNEPGARLYRTGDRVRLLCDGEIDFLGRLDDQVKLHGFRIEVAEVEAVLQRHPGVRETVVGVRTAPSGEARLVAWVAGWQGGGPAAAELRESLRRLLPAAMIPSAFVAVPELPLTANGKVDRAALPEPDWRRPELAGEHVAPRTPLESMLAALWAELLEVERVGIHDSFFDLGGHSLKAARLISRLGETLGVELPLQAVFEAPTVASMSVAIAVRLMEQADAGTLSQALREVGCEAVSTVADPEGDVSTA